MSPKGPSPRIAARGACVIASVGFMGPPLSNSSHRRAGGIDRLPQQLGNAAPVNSMRMKWRHGAAFAIS
jgi:hypothetical protein